MQESIQIWKFLIVWISGIIWIFITIWRCKVSQTRTSNKKIAKKMILILWVNQIENDISCISFFRWQFDESKFEDSNEPKKDTLSSWKEIQPVIWNRYHQNRQSLRVGSFRLDHWTWWIPGKRDARSHCNRCASDSDLGCTGCWSVLRISSSFIRWCYERSRIKRERARVICNGQKLSDIQTAPILKA